MDSDPTPVPTAWVREHTRILSSLDVRADLDDLEPLREVVRDARVVGIAEGAHFVQESTQVRKPVLRLLAGRCGLTVFAFGYSSPAADELDARDHTVTF